MTKLCAICADETAATVMRPLGRGDALVAVCLDCDQGAIVARDSERGYVAPGGLLSTEDAEAGARRVMGDEEYERLAEQERRMGQAPAPKIPEAEAMMRQHIFENKRRWWTGANNHNSKESRGVRASRKDRR